MPTRPICSTSATTATSNDAKHRSKTSRSASQGPHSCSKTQEALFEASCTHKLKGQDQYLTLTEALGQGHRYYKAWQADQIEAPWQPLATTREKPFAATKQMSPPIDWTTSTSHGELIHSSNDESLEIDPADLRFVFQGVDEPGYKAPKYGSIPWKIGILTP